MLRHHQQLQKAAPQPSDRTSAPFRMSDVCYDIFSDQDLLAYLRAPSSSKLGAIAQSPTSSTSTITRDPRGHHSAASSITSSPIASPSPNATLDRSPTSSSPALPFTPLSPLRYGYAACPTGVCYQPLIAANANLPDALRQMAAHGADLNVCDHRGYTPLMRAIKQGSHGAARALLRLMRVSDIDLPGGIREANIHRMAHTSKVYVPRQVVMDGSEATVIANALHVAVNEGSLDAVRALCDRGVDVNQVSFMTVHRDGPPGRFHCCAHARPTSWALYGERARGSAVAIVKHLIARGSKSSHLILEIAQNVEALDDACRGVAAAVLAANPAADCALGRAMCISMDRACAGDFPGCHALVRLMLAAGGVPPGVEDELRLVIRYALATGDTAVLRALLSPNRRSRGASPAAARVTIATPLEGTPLLAAVLRDGFESRARPDGVPNAVGDVLDALLASARAADIARCVLWCPELLALAAGCGGAVARQLLAACDVSVRVPACSMALMFALHTMHAEGIAVPLACALAGLPPTAGTPAARPCALANAAPTSALLPPPPGRRSTASSRFRAVVLGFALAQITQLFHPRCFPGDSGQTAVLGDLLAPEVPRGRPPRPARAALQLQLCRLASASLHGDCCAAGSDKVPPCRVLSVVVLSMDLECSPRQAQTPPCEPAKPAAEVVGSAAPAVLGCGEERTISSGVAGDSRPPLPAPPGRTAASQGFRHAVSGVDTVAAEFRATPACGERAGGPPQPGQQDDEQGLSQSEEAQKALIRRMCVFLNCVLKRASSSAATSTHHSKRQAGPQAVVDRAGCTTTASQRKDRAQAYSAVLPSSRAHAPSCGCALNAELRELICARVFDVSVPLLRSTLRGSAAPVERDGVDGMPE